MGFHQGSGPRRYIDGPPEMAGWYYMNLRRGCLHMTPAPTNQLTPHESVALRQTSRAGSLIGIRACITPKTHTGSSTGMAGRRDIGSRMRQSRRGHQYHRHPPVRPRAAACAAPAPRRCHARPHLKLASSRHRQSPSPYRQAPPARVLPAVRGMPCHAPPPKAPGIALSAQSSLPIPGGRLRQIPARNRDEVCDSTNRHTGPGARRAIVVVSDTFTL